MGVGAKIAVGVVAFGFVAAAGVATKCYFGGACGLKQQAMRVEDARKLAADVVRVAREGAEPELRGWLLSHSPAAVEQILLTIDNTIDPSGKSRLAILGAVHSLGSEGLKPEANAEWAAVLRRSAEGLLHAGPERADFVAKSHLMTGDREKAAAEYARYPQHPVAQLFFKQYPELLRAPASN